MKKHLVAITISFLFTIPSANAIEEVIVTGYAGGGTGVASLFWYVYAGTQFSVNALSKAFDEKPLTEEQKQKNRCNAALKAIDSQMQVCKADAQKSFDSAYTQQCSGLKHNSGYSVQVGLNIATGGGGGGVNVGGSYNSTYNPHESCLQRITINKETSISQCSLNAKLAENSLNCPAQ